MSEKSEGVLYVVATPIGNLDDLSTRAAHILASVDAVAAEDTRHTSKLLRHLGVEQQLVSLHEHNESARVEQIKARLINGESVALVSDAGTPLISDPGFVLVRALREAGCKVVPIPGPCAFVAALSVAGLPTDRFIFEGFLPAKSGARKAQLEEGAQNRDTRVFYESPHRIQDTLQDIQTVLADRRVVLARELTKTFETLLDGTAEELLRIMAEDSNQARGEFVLMLAGNTQNQDEQASQGQALIEAILEEGVGVKTAAAIAHKIHGGGRKQWYQLALTLSQAGN